MDNSTNNSSLSFVRWPVAFVQTLLLFVLTIGSTSPTLATTGYPLIDTLTGAFGDATEFMKTEVTRAISDSGIQAAAVQAKTVLDGLAEGAVPVIDDLSSPYQENAEKAISDAMTKVQVATQILNSFAGEGAKNAITFLQTSPLFAGADFGISTPTGRIRIRVQGTEVSLCQTIVGPLGSLIITGISNAEKLCHFPDDRMSNPTRSLIAFTYMAAGHTHIRTSQVLVPNLAEDLTLLPAPIDAATYIKTIGGQWVQIRLAGADPASVTLEAKFEVGLKGNVSYVVDVEAEGEAALKLSLKPIYAAEVIRTTGEAMLNKATALGLDMNLANQASNTAAILTAGLQHLSDIEENYAEGFGDISIDVKLTGGIGVGVWDTSISAVSANSTFNLTYPLATLLGLGPAVLTEYLDITMGMVEANLKLGTSVLEGDKSGFDTFIASSTQASNDFVTGVMQVLLDASAAEGFTTESTLKITLAGDADKESIPLYESGLKLPVGNISSSLQANPNAFGDAFSAIAYLMLASIDPDAVITEQTWTDLEKVIVPDIKFTLRVWNPVTLGLFGFKDADLLETIKTFADIRDILISVATSSVNESLNDIRAAIDNVITTAINNADDAVIAWINNAKIETSTSVGANGTLGAEGVAEIGASIGIEGQVSGSLFLLLANLDIYQKPIDPDYPDDPEKGGLLAKAAMPVNLSLDAGASVGEGVELTVDAGGAVSLNLFELTATHWEGDLPSAALMDIAGFTIIEFNGTTKADGSFSGPGYLMLPMGGLVSADFAVDEFGNVIDVVDEFGNLVESNWSGGLELGPLGDFPFIEGTIENDGLHGTININLLGSSFDADFILNSSGFLLGSYDGSININGHELVAASISLDADGQFRGHYNGEIMIAGFAADSNLDFDNSGLTGSSYLNVLGSELIANEISINSAGTVSGTFTGEIVAGPHTLSAVSLQTVNGGLIGTAMMELPGIAAAEVELRIFDGKVSAIYQSDLFNGLVSQASFEITNTGIIMSANLNTSQFTSISGQVLNLVADAASLAQGLIGQAEEDLETAQTQLANAEAALNAANTELTSQLETLQQNVLDAAAKAQTALQELNVVIAKIDELNAFYQSLLSDAQGVVNSAQSAVNSAQGVVNYYNNQINSLYNWYNGLSTYNKVKYAAYYTSKRTQYFSLRTAANVVLATAQTALSAAQIALDLLNSELADLLNPFEISRGLLQTAYNIADQALTIAQQELAQLEADIIADTALLPLYTAIDLAQSALTLAQKATKTLNATIAMAEYFATEGAESAFSVLSANVTADLDTLNSSSSFEVDARVTYLGQVGQVRFMFDPADLLKSLSQLVSELQAGNMSLANNDVIPPIVIASQPAEWASEQTLINLIAKDNNGGTGIASITFSATGAQVLSEETVAGKEAFVLINTEGLTSLSFYATDISGNVSETTTISVSIDNSGPQISVTPSGINEGVYEVVINVEDLLGSGIEYITVSGIGAEYIGETISLANETIVSLTVEGFTTLTITAVDVTGNSTTLTHEVTVPRLFTDNGAPINSSADTVDSSSGGGALGLIWLLLITMMVCLRRSQLLNKRQKA